MIFSARLKAEGEIIPMGYGIAWRDYLRDVYVCYPIPFNIIAGYTRRLWHWAMTTCALKHSLIDDYYYKGYDAAMKHERRFKTL